MEKEEEIAFKFLEDCYGALKKSMEGFCNKEDAEYLSKMVMAKTMEICEQLDMDKMDFKQLSTTIISVGSVAINGFDLGRGKP